LINNLSKRDKYFIGFVIIVGSVSIYFSFFLLPTIKQIKDSHSMIDNYRASTTKGRVSQIQLKSPVEKKDLLISLPEVERNSEIAYNVKIMADKSLIEFDKLAFGEITVLEDKQFKNGINLKGKLFAIPINIVVSGNYSNLEKFVKQLEGDKRFCEITEFNVTQGIIGKVVVNIELRYFYFEGIG
jgi:hypothetical protein